MIREIEDIKSRGIREAKGNDAFKKGRMSLLNEAKREEERRTEKYTLVTFTFKNIHLSNVYIISDLVRTILVKW